LQICLHKALKTSTFVSFGERYFTVFLKYFIESHHLAPLLSVTAVVRDNIAFLLRLRFSDFSWI